MNLQINLILESEKRSAASIRLLFAVRLVLVLIPTLMLLYLALLFYQTQTLTKETAHLQELIAARQDQLAISAQVSRQKKMYEEMITQLETWSQSRLPLQTTLESLRLTVPLEVQFTSLQFARTTLYTNGFPVAQYKMQIRGKTRGEEAELTVERFLQNVLHQSGLAENLASAQVPPGAFMQDRDPGAHPLDRVFMLECLFKPRGKIKP